MSERCDYHQNLGHTTDNYVTLPYAIQDLIDSKKISDPSTPNVARNPLPNHHVHAIEEDLHLPDHVLLIHPISEKRKEEIQKLDSQKLTCAISEKMSFKENEEEDETLLGLDVRETSSRLNHTTIVHNPTIMRWMKKMKFVPGFGLGKKHQGITDILQPKGNPRHQELGYNHAQRKSHAKKWNAQIGIIAFDWNKVIVTKETAPVIPPSKEQVDPVAT